MQRPWENSGSRGRVHQAIATHDTNSNAALSLCSETWRRSWLGWATLEFLCFSVDSTCLGIRKPLVLVVVISFSCYVLLWCPHASNAQKIFTRKVLSRDGNLRLPHEFPRTILQIPWTESPWGTIIISSTTSKMSDINC